MSSIDPNHQTLPDPKPVRRVWKIALSAWAIFAAIYCVRGDFRSLGGLTCGGLVVMINFLWLEGIAFKFLGPDPQVKPWKVGVRALGRYALLGLFAAVFVVRFNILSVLLGTSILVIGIIGEALYEWWCDLGGGVDR